MDFGCAGVGVSVSVWNIPYIAEHLKQREERASDQLEIIDSKILTMD